MQRGKVTGSVWATRRMGALEGVRLALVRRRGPDGRLQKKEEVAVEVVEAGVGDEVLLADGREASLAMPDDKTFAPVDLAVVGLLDIQDWEED